MLLRRKLEKSEGEILKSKDTASSGSADNSAADGEIRRQMLEISRLHSEIARLESLNFELKSNIQNYERNIR
jgi:hypothetical protein